MENMVFKFMELPRELRDQVYRYLFADSHPVIRMQNLCICPTGCSLGHDREFTKFPVQVLLTCQQMYDEGRLVMYHDNIWGLEWPAITPNYLTNMMMFNEHLLDMSRRHQSASEIRFLDFPIHIAPFIKRYLTEEEARSLRDAGRPAAEEVLTGRAYTISTEAAECKRHKSILHYLALAHRDLFPQLQSVTVSLNWHPLGFVGQDQNCHCLNFLVRLHRQNIPPSHDSPSKWDIEDIEDIEDIGPYEPRRQIFTAFTLFDNLQNIEVQLQANPDQATATDTSSTENGSDAMRDDPSSNDAPSDSASSDSASSNGASSDSASSDSASSNETSSSEAPQKEAPKKREPPKEHPVRTFRTVEQMLNAAGVNFHNFTSS